MRWLGAAVIVAAILGVASTATAGREVPDCVPSAPDADVVVVCDDISVEKTAGTVVDADGEEVLAGGTIVYTIKVCNLDEEFAAQGIVFFDQLPVGTSFQSSAAADFHLAFGETQSQVVGTLDELAAGACSTAFITAEAADDAPCGLELTNRVTVSSRNDDVDEDDNADSFTTEVTCPEPEPTPTATTTPAPTTPKVGTGDGSVGPPPPTNGGNGAGQSGQCTGPAAERPTSCQSPGGVSGR